MIIPSEFKMDGYYTYQDFDIVNLFQFIWCIPEELHNNETVRDKINHQLFEEFIGYMNEIDDCNFMLKPKVLDSDKKPLLNKKQKLKWKCHQILNEANDKLSPYHWEIQKIQDDYRRDCYIIGLFNGEDKMTNIIEKM